MLDWQFSPAVESALHTIGWSRARRVPINSWIQALQGEGYKINSYAQSVLESFGGLSIQPVNQKGPNFHNEDPLTFDPIAAGSGLIALATELKEILGGDWYPIGEWFSNSSFFISDSGRTVATGLDWLWEMGATPNEAIEFALSANRPLTCIAVITPGVQPWPTNNL